MKRRMEDFAIKCCETFNLHLFQSNVMWLMTFPMSYYQQRERVVISDKELLLASLPQKEKMGRGQYEIKQRGISIQRTSGCFHLCVSPE